MKQRLPVAGGEWDEALVFNGYRGSVRDDEKVLGMDNHDSYTDVNIPTVTELYI